MASELASCDPTFERERLRGLAKKMILVWQTGRALESVATKRSIAEQQRELTARECDISGGVSQLRDRLLRAHIRAVEPHKAAIPWDARDCVPRPMIIGCAEEIDSSGGSDLEDSGFGSDESGVSGASCLSRVETSSPQEALTVGDWSKASGPSWVETTSPLETRTFSAKRNEEGTTDVKRRPQVETWSPFEAPTHIKEREKVEASGVKWLPQVETSSPFQALEYREERKTKGVICPSQVEAKSPLEALTLQATLKPAHKRTTSLVSVFKHTGGLAACEPKTSERPAEKAYSGVKRVRWEEDSGVGGERVEKKEYKSVVACGGVQRKDSGVNWFSEPESMRDSRGTRPEEGVRVMRSKRLRSPGPEPECARQVPCRAGSGRESLRSSWIGCPTISAGESENALSRKLKIVKLLQRWGLSFADDGGDTDPEEFLEQLDDCCDATDVSDRELLSALPCVLKDKAARWFRVVRGEVATRGEFKRAFRCRFVRELDHWGLLHDLRGRTQGPGERVASFLADFKYIISRFEKPPSEKYQVEQAFRNLLPEFRHDIADKEIETLRDIERLGRRWERHRKLDERYVPPPLAEEMSVPAAAYAWPEKKIGGIEISGESEEKSEISGVREGERGENNVVRKESEDGDEWREALEVSVIECGSKSTNLPAKRTSKRRRRRHRGRPATTYGWLEEGPPTYAGLDRAPAPSERVARQTANCERFRRYEVAACELVASVEAGPTGGCVAAVVEAQPPPPTATACPQVRVESNRGPRFATPSDLGWIDPWKRSRAIRGPQVHLFGGVCYCCRALGHRRAECPEIRCFCCADKGHMIRTCPEKK